MIAGGIGIIQYREKKAAKSSSEIFAECLKIREMTRAAGVTFIVNDHVDVAMLVGADGVHVGQDDLPVADVRRLLGPGKIIGLSTHSPEQATEAVKCGADYIGVGPIFATKTKDDVCDAVGFSSAASSCTISMRSSGAAQRPSVSLRKLSVHPIFPNGSGNCRRLSILIRPKVKFFLRLTSCPHEE